MFLTIECELSEIIYQKIISNTMNAVYIFNQFFFCIFLLSLILIKLVLDNINKPVIFMKVFYVLQVHF